MVNSIYQPTQPTQNIYQPTQNIGVRFKINSRITPPSHMTLAQPKSWFFKHNLHTIDII